MIHTKFRLDENFHRFVDEKSRKKTFHQHFAKHSDANKRRILSGQSFYTALATDCYWWLDWWVSWRCSRVASDRSSGSSSSSITKQWFLALGYSANLLNALNHCRRRTHALFLYAQLTSSEHKFSQFTLKTPRSSMCKKPSHVRQQSTVWASKARVHPTECTNPIIV